MLSRLLASSSVLKHAVAGGRQATASSFDDVAITSKVALALQDESSLRAPGLVVATKDRVVRLSGAVCSQAHIDTAARIARAIGGVLVVRNDLRLMPH
jgi:hyperosmotically inducible protein